MLRNTVTSLYRDLIPVLGDSLCVMANLIGKSEEFVERAKKRAEEERKKKEEEDKDSRSHHAHYGEPLYWEQRYEFQDKRQMQAGTKLFDWYAPYDKIYPVLESVIDTTRRHKTLLIGIGKSNMVEHMVSKGFNDMICVDVSSYIISKMKTKYAMYTGIEFLCLDVRDMSYFNDNTFSLVIDKGCMDSIFCCTNFMEESTQMFKEMLRIMKPQAQFLSISHASPASRVPYLRTVRWAVETCAIPEGEHLNLFFMTKTDDQSMIDRRIAGAEAGTRAKSKNLKSSLEQTMNKSSTTRNKENNGQLTVSADVDVIAAMVSEMEDSTS